MRVLVADDDPAYRSLLEDLLTQWNYDVLLACDGNEAWEVMQCPDKPNLVILDWMMPRMDGLETLRALRQIRPDVKVILCSGYSETDTTSRLADEHVAGFLQKPFQLSDLTVKVRAAMKVGV